MPRIKARYAGSVPKLIKEYLEKSVGFRKTTYESFKKHEDELPHMYAEHQVHLEYAEPFNETACVFGKLIDVEIVLFNTEGKEDFSIPTLKKVKGMLCDELYKRLAIHYGGMKNSIISLRIIVVNTI